MRDGQFRAFASCRSSLGTGLKYRGSPAVRRAPRLRGWERLFMRRITCVRPCHTADLYACVAAAWQPRAALEAKSEHPRRSRREGQPQELPAASIDPTADDCCCATNKLYSELALRCGRIGFRLPVRVPPAAAERAAVGACMTMRSWHGSGGSCAVLAMRDGGRDKNFGCLRPVGGLRRARGV